MISDKDLLSRQQARQLAHKAREAANQLAAFSQTQIDSIIDAMAQAVDKEAENLARLAVEETTYGNVPDKIIKNRFSSRQVYQFIRPLRTAGIIGEDAERKILMVAEPVGVVAAILPVTNPTSTAIYKILISLKGRNSIVLSPHPSAKRCICRAAEIMEAAARAAGAPEGAISCMTDVSSEGTQELMRDRNVNVILATGGMGIVRLAYSCGKPAFGVGPGNVPSFIERSADIEKAVRDTVAGKTFDNGVLCSSEQSLVCESVIKEQVVQELKKLKAHFLTPEQIEILGKVVITPTFGVNPKIVGKKPVEIASVAGFSVPAETSVLIAPLKNVGKEHPLSLEKLSPILAFYEVSDFNAGIELCRELLRYGGMGHTASFHSTNQELIREAGLRIPVFRLIINSPATHGSVGLTTGLDPAMTLGCGAIGGNITSDNISPLHLINIKRVAYEIRPAGTPIAAQQPETSGSLEEKIGKFLDQRGLVRTLPSPPPPPPTQPAIKPVAQQTETVRLGEHKIYPIRPPEQVKSTVIANPTVSHNPHSSPVDFVCEEDVRRALTNNEIITVHSKTIITPSAQDLAFNRDIFKIVDK